MKKANAQDSTRRNIQAANKKLAAFLERFKKLEARVKKLEKSQVETQ